ncbi:hypothetical protein [Roseateles sp. P5_E11]
MTVPHQHGPTPGTATCQDLLAELKQPMAELQTLREQAIETLTPAVQEMVRGGSRDVQRIEHALDQLLDIACLPEGLTLFKTLCRHYWTLHPQATAGYIHAYREMWDADDQNDADEVAP